MTEHDRLLDEQLAAHLERLWSVQPDPAAASDGRSAALGALGSPRLRRRRWTYVGAAAAAVTTLSGVGAAAAAQDALPGDTTYGLKLGIERVEVAWARGDEAEAEAWLEVAETRVEEAVRAGAEGRYTLMPEILDGYAEAVAAVRENLQAVKTDTPAAAVVARAERELRTHEQVLAALVAVVPPQARPGLERARDAGHDAHGPDAPPHAPPAAVPPEVDPPVPVPRPTQTDGAQRTPAAEKSRAPTPRPSPESQPSPAYPTAAPPENDGGQDRPESGGPPAQAPTPADAGPPDERPYP